MAIGHVRKGARKYYMTKGIKREAEKLKVKMLSEIHEGTFIGESKKTVEQYLLEWLDTYIKPTKSPTKTKGICEPSK